MSDCDFIKSGNNPTKVRFQVDTKHNTTCYSCKQLRCEWRHLLVTSVVKVEVVERDFDALPSNTDDAVVAGEEVRVDTGVCGGEEGA